VSEKKTGLAPLPANLLRPTTKPEDVPPEPAEATAAVTTPAADPAAEAAKPARTRRRRERAPLSTETRGCKLYLPEDIHDRLKLLAIKRRKKLSTLAAELLDKALPRFRLEEEP
jgi:hypothetical protein